MKEKIKCTIRYSVLALVTGVAVGAIDTIFGRGLLWLSDFRTAHYRYLLPFLPVAGLLIVWMYHRFSEESLKGMTLVLETGQKKKKIDPTGTCSTGNRWNMADASVWRKCGKRRSGSTDRCCDIPRGRKKISLPGK